jgi:hypothetical protein
MFYIEFTNYEGGDFYTCTVFVGLNVRKPYEKDQPEEYRR